MKRLFFFILALVSLACALSLPVYAQTKIDLANQVKGVLGAGNGGTGTAGQPSASVSPSLINFGTQQSGTTTPDQSLTLTNTGQVPIVVSALTFTGSADLSSTNPNLCNGVLAAGASCVYAINYHPPSVGADAATATAHTTAPIDVDNPLTVALSGTGTAATTFPLSGNCSGTGSGSVQSGETPPLINFTCAPPAAPTGVFSNNYPTGAVVALTATASGGSDFVNFSGCGLSGSPGNCTVSAPTNLTATFILTPQTAVLSLTGIGQGAGTTTSDINDVLSGTPINCTTTAGVLTGKCSGTFNVGAIIVLTETPAP